MKNKFRKGCLCLLAVLLLLTGISNGLAEETGRTVGDAQAFMEGIAAYQLKTTGAASLQGWIDGGLTKNAGVSSEWYVMALSQYGSYDFSSYHTALLRYLQDNTVPSASSRQKYALALIACGSTDAYIDRTLNDSIGRQGVMSWIFGLHLLNNGYQSSRYSLAAVKQKLLSLQHEDGGWAVTGTGSDTDVTAMAIQALAPYERKDTSVKAAVNKALVFLSNRQKDTGDYASYGVYNPESTAQVLVALSCLGIDCRTDSRFIKNGNTLLDGIALYRLSDGSFCHKLGGGSNGTATSQVFYSMVAYLRMKNGQGPFYVLDARNPSGLNKADDTVSQTPDTGTTGTAGSASESKAQLPADNPSTSMDDDTHAAGSITASAASQFSAASDGSQSKNALPGTDLSQGAPDTAETDPASSSTVPETAEPAEELLQQNNASAGDAPSSGAGGYKGWVCLALAVIAGAVCLVLYVGKKRNLRNFIVIGILAAIAMVLVLVTDFQSTDSYYQQADADKKAPVGTVTVTIRCDRIGDKSAEHIPDDGILLDTASVTIEEGDTVYDVLWEAAAKAKIHLETTGSGDSVYVQGIGHIYEFDFGDLSGWMYFVNGASPSVSCGEYVLADGDRVEWLYTCAMGEDLP